MVTMEVMTPYQTATSLLAADIDQELDWLAAMINARFVAYFEPENAEVPSAALTPPDLAASGSAYAALVRDHDLDDAARAAIALALAPHLRPQALDVFFTRNRTYDRRFTEFGGDYNTSAAGFIPTWETLAFLLAGAATAARLRVMRLTLPEHPLLERNILLHQPTKGDPPLAARLQLTDTALHALTVGTAHRPNFGAAFPAQRLTTAQTWEDLVLHPATRQQITEIEWWLRHGGALRDQLGMASRLRPGHRGLFYGPPGTGKTLTACLLGQATGRDVYRVDLSLTVSKYIGETEKNLARVFSTAEQYDWILFFDEADALFGSRGTVRTAQDRYANQEIAYLLQRVETFDGLVILASNRRDELDEAFTRRFESMVYFPPPRAAERLQLWEGSLPPGAALAPDVDLAELAEAHEFTGGEIVNAVRHAALRALAHGEGVIGAEDIVRGIQREYEKSGKRS